MQKMIAVLWILYLSFAGCSSAIPLSAHESDAGDEDTGVADSGVADGAPDGDDAAVGSCRVVVTDRAAAATGRADEGDG